MTEYANEYMDRDTTGISVNEPWKEFRDKINNMIEKYLPTIRAKRENHLPWYTREISKCMRKLYHIYGKLKKNTTCYRHNLQDRYR